MEAAINASLHNDKRVLTVRSGPAPGGRKAGKDTSQPGQSLVCYHNPQRIADYGKLGHGEVVGLKVPPSTVGKFAEAYAALFDAGGDRPDKGDRGGEYRSLVGLPGGETSPLAGVVAKALEGSGDAEKCVLVPVIYTRNFDVGLHTSWESGERNLAAFLKRSY